MNDAPESSSPPRGRSFGAVAQAYQRGRPGYPADAARWATSTEQASVLELGAGTGKLTHELVALGHDVHATEPDPAMLAVLERELPDVRASLGVAEEIPAPDNSCDVVVAGQCFGWFDLDRAIPEIVRVLRPGGRLSLVWNERDESIPWVKKLGRIIATPEQSAEHAGATEVLGESMKFIMVEEESFGLWQTVNRKTIWDLVQSRSAVAILDEEEQDAKRAEVLDFYDGYGRGMDGMRLPYRTRCLRARVVKVRRAAPTPTAPDSDPGSTPGSTPDENAAPVDQTTGSRSPVDPLPDLAPRSEPPRAPRHDDDTVERVRPADPPRDRSEDEDDDDGMLLIDFR